MTPHADPYRCPYPHPHVHTPTRKPPPILARWLDTVLAVLLVISAGVNAAFILAWPRELGHWTERTELNAAGETDLVLRGPHGREVLRMTEGPPPTTPVP